MDIATLLGVALALAMDAFAVSIGLGLCGKEPVLRRSVRVALHFGVFQSGMTLGGYLAGWAASGWLQAVSCWASAGLLWFVAAHMLLGAFRRPAPSCEASDADGAGTSPRPAPELSDPARGFALLTLSVATSLDAFGAGMSLALLGSTVWVAAGVIGVVAALMSAVGIAIARGFAASTGRAASRAAEVLGALILVGIGVKIALESAT